MERTIFLGATNVVPSADKNLPSSRTAWFRFKARMEKERRLEMLYSVKGSGETTGKERPKTAEEYVEECREAPAR